MQLGDRRVSARRVRSVSLGLVVIMVMLVSACKPAPLVVTYTLGTETIPGGAGSIAVLGDSITNGARVELAAELSDPRYAFVNGKNLDLYRDRFDEAQKIAVTNPEVAVVHLGTNDWWCGFANVMPTVDDCRYPEFVWADEVPDALTMVGIFPEGTCLLLTQVFEAPGVVDPVNDLLPSWVADGTIDGFVPWQDYLMGLPAEERALLMADDGIGHLSPAGSQKLAEVTDTAVDFYCPPTTGPTTTTAAPTSTSAPATSAAPTSTTELPLG